MVTHPRQKKFSEMENSPFLVSFRFILSILITVKKMYLKNANLIYILESIS